MSLYQQVGRDSAEDDKRPSHRSITLSEKFPAVFCKECRSEFIIIAVTETCINGYWDERLWPQERVQFCPMCGAAYNKQINATETAREDL